MAKQRFGPDCDSCQKAVRGSVRRRVFRGFAGAVASVALAGGLAGTAAATTGDTAGGTSVANVNVNSAISLTGLTPAFTLSGVPGATVTDVGAVVFTVQTNNLAGYVVTVQSQAPVLSPSTGGNSDSIPIGALSVRETGTTVFTPLSNTVATLVHSQGTRSTANGDSLSDDYRVVIPFVNQGIYETTLNYVTTAL